MIFTAILRGALYHFCLYGIGFFSALLLGGSYKLIPRLKKNVSYGYARFMCHLLLRSSGVEISVNGKERFDALKDKSVILLSNHITTLDVPIQMHALHSYDITYMYSLKTVQGIPVIGYLVRFIFNSFDWLGVNPDKTITLKRFLDKVRLSRLHGTPIKIGIYPEGDRSKQGEINEFRGGAFYAAALLRLPIVPILVQGVLSVHKVRTFPVYANKVGVHILPPIHPQPLKEDLSNLHQIAADLRKKIKQLFTEIPDLNTDYNAYVRWQERQRKTKDEIYEKIPTET